MLLFYVYVIFLLKSTAQLEPLSNTTTTSTTTVQWSSTLNASSTKKNFALLQRKHFAKKLQRMVTKAQDNFQDMFKDEMQENDIFDLKVLCDKDISRNLSQIAAMANSRFWDKSLLILDIPSPSPQSSTPGTPSWRIQ